MRKYTISVVTPCYNAATFLSEALGSVRNQTRAVDEIIVVDDGSTDESVDVARRMAACCVSTLVNSGPSAARNLGIQLARGDVIAFLDADDSWEPEHCDRVVGLLERHEGAAAAFSRERRIGSWDGRHDRVLPADQPVDAFWDLLWKNMVPQMGIAVRRDALVAMGGYNEAMRYAEDYDLWLRLARRYRFVCTHAVTCNHRGHDDQASSDDLSLAHGAFEARHHAWNWSREHDPPEVTARMEATIRAAWEYYLSRVWLRRDREAFDAALALHLLVPGAEPIRRRWQRRAQLIWPVYMGAAHVWEHLPGPLRSSIRRRLPL